MSGITPDSLGTIQFLRHTEDMQPNPDDLRRLHDHYVAAINAAVTADDHPLIDQLSAAYENEARQLVGAAA